MKRKVLYISIPIIALCAFFYFYTSYNSKQTIVYQKCPDDYATDDAGSKEYLAATDKWTNDFFDAHPGSTLSDWANARKQFWVENKCTLAIQRYEEAKSMSADTQ